LVPGARPPAKAPYRMAPGELFERNYRNCLKRVIFNPLKRRIGHLSSLKRKKRGPLDYVLTIVLLIR
jgi:hypothetical protein